MLINIPYGTASLPLDPQRLPNAEVLCSGAAHSAEADSDGAVLRAMDNPIGSPRLAELARGAANAVIICSDHTRPVPSRNIVPHMLAELRAGNPSIAVTLLVATGFHRATTREELAAKFGEEIVRRERIVVHDSADDASLAHIGTLPSGAPLTVNRLAAETDLLLAEGFIEPHFFAGFSGGRKSVLPGVCGRRTVLGNHCAQFIDHPCARTGILAGNPIHRDMLAAAEMARLRYIVNVVIDAERRVVAAFAGDFKEAHAAGCEHLRGMCRVAPTRPGDIVITSNGGAPLDQNVYQMVKGLSAAEAAAAPGATLIIASACADGSGGDDFFRMLRDCESPAQLLADIRAVPMDRTEPDQWEAQILARILMKHRVIVVCDEAARAVVSGMKMETATTLDGALDNALAARPDARVTVIPDGVGVIVECAQSRE